MQLDFWFSEIVFSKETGTSLKRAPRTPPVLTGAQPVSSFRQENDDEAADGAAEKQKCLKRKRSGEEEPKDQPFAQRHKTENNNSDTSRGTAFDELVKSIKARHVGCSEVWERIKDHKEGKNFLTHRVTRLLYNNNVLTIHRSVQKIPFSLKTHFEQILDKFDHQLLDQVRHFWNSLFAFCGVICDSRR